jgi:PAS domain S-box-containing protein
MEGAGGELVQERIKDLWEKTDFSAALFENLVGYAVIAADFDGNVLAFNEGARQMYGFDPEEVLGKENIEIFFPQDFIEAGYFQQIADVLLATGGFLYEGEKVRKSGDRFPAQILFTLTRNRLRQVVGFVEIVQDLTERKRVEVELRSHRDHLEALVAERTAELAQTNKALQVEVAQRKQVETELRWRAQELAEADKRKDEFLAMLAHELRNPLAPILNGFHILRLPNVDSSTAERVRLMMEQQVGHLTRLVDDLLDVSRITRGKIRLQKETIDLAAVVGRAVETVRPLIELQKHQLSVSLPPHPVPLEADPTRLEQIVTNLLNNAAKYTEPGGQIWLTAERDNAEVVVRIRDTGIGISDELLPRIFDMFTQADRALDRAQGGLGIGLTLVRRLAELHGGRVLAHSAGVGQGSEFMVRLPAPSGQPRQPAAPAKEPELLQGGRRVLVVEDEAAVAEMLVMLLQLWGHSVQAVHDGPTALATAKCFYPEVVLCDIGLPGMDGYQLARQLRDQGAAHKPMLVAVTGYGQEEDQRRAQRAGFDHHMTKPVNPIALKKLLDSLALT